MVFGLLGERGMKKKFLHVPSVRKGQGSVDLSREEFEKRAKEIFEVTAKDGDSEAIRDVIDDLYEGYEKSRKSPKQMEVGDGFADPKFEMGKEWVDAFRRLADAKIEHHDSSSPDRILVINASPRSDNTCPGEVSKTHRLAQIAREELVNDEALVEYLDLSRLTSEYGKKIYPCKGCVSTSMALCHWPCSCYPNHALGQVQDWMGEIYEMWMRTHGVMIVAPVHWYSMPSVLKLMMDRMVCADGGNPDPSTTQGKNPELAKRLELEGWRYPKHLAGRRYSIVVHGDAAGALHTRQAIAGWLNDSGLVSAGEGAEIDRYVGYYEPYASSHEFLDRDARLEEEVRASANRLRAAVREYRMQLVEHDSRPGLRYQSGPRISGSEVYGSDSSVRPK